MITSENTSYPRKPYPRAENEKTINIKKPPTGVSKGN